MGADYLVIDDFLPGFVELRDYLVESSDFGGAEGPDGVVYPDICTDIPQVFKDDIQAMLDQIATGNAEITQFFARKSSEGVDAPHQVHSDLEWADWTLIVYMNKLEDCIGGTSFLRHQLGFSTHPINQKQVDIWREDTNNPDKWSVYDVCEMVPNRAVIFPAKMLHRAEPLGGFGTTNEDSRIVLTAFFNDKTSN